MYKITALVILALVLTGTQAHAADVFDSQGRRIESIRPYPDRGHSRPAEYDRIDPRTGNRLGTVQELSPGNGHLLDRNGNTVGRIQCPPRENCLGR